MLRNIIVSTLTLAACSGNKMPSTDVIPNADVLAFCTGSSTIVINGQRYSPEAARVVVGTPPPAETFLTFTYLIILQGTNPPRQLVTFVQTGGTLADRGFNFSNAYLNTSFAMHLVECTTPSCSSEPRLDGALDKLTISDAVVNGWQVLEYSAERKISLCLQVRAQDPTSHPLLKQIEVALYDVEPEFRTIGP